MSMNPKQLLAAFAATLVLTACAFLMPSAPPVVEGRVASFPHDVHVDDEVALDCIECHMDAEDGPMAGMPTLDMCWACHEEATQKDKPLEAQLVGFVLPSDVEATWSTVTRAAIDSNFSHQTHLEAGTDCLDCHIGVDQADRVDWDWHISMDQCINCHEHSDGLAPTDDCKACHQDIDQFTMPANHNGGWDRVHGMLSLDGPGCPDQPSRNCSLCHSDSSCDNCHATTEPSNHTEAWRLRGHGFSAQMNRESCATCHTEASCDSCHSTMTPVSHGGNFGGRTSAHCVGCHLPLGSEDSCTACHKSTPSHLQASLRPGPPHPGPVSDCRSCHFPLDHIDNGQDCNSCHR